MLALYGNDKPAVTLCDYRVLQAVTVYGRVKHFVKLFPYPRLLRTHFSAYVFKLRRGVVRHLAFGDYRIVYGVLQKFIGIKRIEKVVESRAHTRRLIVPGEYASYNPQHLRNIEQFTHIKHAARLCTAKRVVNIYKSAEAGCAEFCD